MSLLGGIVDYYLEGDTAELTALRTALGSAKMYADQIPNGQSMPYCILEESNASNYAETMGQTGRRSHARDITVSFSVWASGRQRGEEILEALENAYLTNECHLTLENRFHGGTYFSNRSTLLSGNAWNGVLELRFRVIKSAS